MNSNLEDDQPDLDPDRMTALELWSHANWLLSNGDPVPLDILARLEAEGCEVSALTDPAYI